jgi:hypothetical protein
MPEDKKIRYPMLSAKYWWALRKRFATSMPKDVSPSLLGPMFKMNPKSAGNNIIPALKLTKIIDNDGKPTDRAYDWRDNKKYPEVCQQILNEIYPQELLDLAPDTNTDRKTILDWFANTARVGEDAANRFANFYLLLLEADPSKEHEAPSPSSTSKGKPKVATAAASPKRGQSRTSSSKHEQPSEEQPSEASTPPREAAEPVKNHPSLHLNIQIHIAPETNPEQLDQIFASMAKHLKDLM